MIVRSWTYNLRARGIQNDEKIISSLFSFLFFSSLFDRSFRSYCLGIAKGVGPFQPEIHRKERERERRKRKRRDRVHSNKMCWTNWMKWRRRYEDGEIYFTMRLLVFNNISNFFSTFDPNLKLASRILVFVHCDKTDIMRYNTWNEFINVWAPPRNKHWEYFLWPWIKLDFFLFLLLHPRQSIHLISISIQLKYTRVSFSRTGLYSERNRFKIFNNSLIQIIYAIKFLMINWSIYWQTNEKWKMKNHQQKSEVCGRWMKLLWKNYLNIGLTMHEYEHLSKTIPPILE